MKKRQLLVSSALAILMSASLIAGATYSLFTSESTHDITVSSGTVNVDSTILDDFELRSMGEIMPAKSFANGGTAAFEGNVLKLINITPGDEVIFNLSILNKSTVKTKYRVSLRCASGPELFSGLVITPDFNSDWKSLKVDANPTNPTPVNKQISVKLPQEAGDTYQGLDTSILINVEAVQDNATNYNPTTPGQDTIDDQVLANKLNSYIDNSETVPQTMKDVSDILFVNGVNLEELTTKTPNTYYLYDQDTNTFVIGDATNEVIYPTGVTTSKDHLWKVVDAYDDASPFSQYLRDKDFEGAALNLNVDTGLDLGSNKEEFKITYAGTSSSNLIINTTNPGTDLTINTTTSEITHYGELGKLTITEVPSNCYFEFGTTSYAEINKGKAIIKDGGEISVLLVEPKNVQDVAVVEKDASGTVSKAYASTQKVKDEHTGNVVLTYGTSVEDIKTEGNTKITADKEAKIAASDLKIVDGLGNITKATLAEFRDSVNRGTSYKGKTITLLKDVDLKDYTNWAPIGTKAHPFEGIFDGDHKTIKNMNIKAVGYFGLFGYVTGEPNVNFNQKKDYDKLWDGQTFDESLISENKYTAVIKNVVLSNVKTEVIPLNDDANRAQAALVGFPNNAYISDITVSNSDIQVNKYGGTVAGDCHGTILKNITNDSTTTIRNNVVGVVNDNKPTETRNSGNSGALVGRTRDNCAIINATNNAHIVLGKGYGGFGGIVGFGDPVALYKATNNSDIIYDADATPYYVGGINGYTTAGSLMIDAINNGRIYANTQDTNTHTIGGIVGYAGNTSTRFYNCVNNGDIEGSTLMMGGIVGYGATTSLGVPQFTNCSSIGTLTNHNVNGFTNEFNGRIGNRNIKNSTYATVAALQEAITSKSNDYYGIYLDNVTVTDPSGILSLPANVTSFVSTKKVASAIKLENPTKLVSVKIDMPDTNYEISTDLSNMNLSILNDRSTVTVTNSGKLHNLTVTGTGSTVSITGTRLDDERLNRLIVGGEGTTAIIRENTLIGGVSITSLGTVTLNNYGKISSTQENGNHHTISSTGLVEEGTRAVIINNHGTIESKSTGKQASYTLLFYDGCKATLNAYAGSKVIAYHPNLEGNYLIAINKDISHLTINYVEGTTYEIKGQSYTWDQYYKDNRITVNKVGTL